MRRRLATAALLALWTLLVLYPNPLLLARSITQSWTPVIDPAAVRALAATLPDDPAAIEQAVLTRIVPYAVPWDVYGVPWYYPTPAEVLAAGRSDCEGRAVVLASLLAAKGIPFSFSASFDHIWIDYPGKHPNASENPAVALAQKAPTATYWLHWPQEWDLRHSWDVESAYFLAPMPGWRWAILIAGWVAIVLVRRALQRRKAAANQAILAPLG